MKPLVLLALLLGLLRRTSVPSTRPPWPASLRGTLAWTTGSYASAHVSRAKTTVQQGIRALKQQFGHVVCGQPKFLGKPALHAGESKNNSLARHPCSKTVVRQHGPWTTQVPEKVGFPTHDGCVHGKNSSSARRECSNIAVWPHGPWIVEVHETLSYA
jgi:hypothetical protein